MAAGSCAASALGLWMPLARPALKVFRLKPALRVRVVGSGRMPW
jgi:hypothetical protein